MNNRVWVLGDAVVDLIPDGPERYLKCPGGAPANVAVGVARLGGNSGFIGRVGQDPLGRFLCQTLQQEGVATEQLAFDSQHGTSTVLVELDEQGERSFHFLVRPSADLFLTETELPHFSPCQWLHLCSIALSQEPSRSAAFAAMAQIRAAGGYVSFDPNIRLEMWAKPEELKPCLERALSLATAVKLSCEELAYLGGAQDMATSIQALMTRYPIARLFVTLGAEGVLVHDGQQLHRLPAYCVTPVDTTGAGDAFVAGLLAGLAERDALPEWRELQPIVAQAQYCGALATTAKGAMTALPYREALLEGLPHTAG